MAPEDPDERRVTRRSLLTGLPGLFRRSASAFSSSLDDPALKPVARSTGGGLPPRGEPLEGLPAVHPWIVVAFAVAERLRRRLPYGLFLGASGEAFAVAWDRDDPASALDRIPGNSFLSALALAGLTPRAATGGPLEPALGGAEVSLGKGFAVVLGTSRGPGLLDGVDRKARTLTWSPFGGGTETLPFDRFGETWAQGSWPGGPAPWLRVAVERGGNPRPLTEVAKVGIRALLARLAETGLARHPVGLRAWDALADDLEAGSVPEAAARAFLGEPIARIAVGRAAAGGFLEAVARAVPPHHREPLLSASRCFREVHQPHPEGEIYGTGLLPDFARLFLEEGELDPARLASPPAVERAVALLRRIREREARVVELLSGLPDAL